MNTKLALNIALATIFLILLYSLKVYPQIPDPMPIHWNIRGEVDGWCPKAQGVLMMPIIMIVILIMLQGFPMLRMRGASVEAFRSTYNYIMVIVTALMGYVQIVILQACLDPHLDLTRTLLGGIYLFFALIGNVMGKLRPNRWAGVRTPWTMKSNAVWVGTHRFAARLWTATGLIGLVAVLLRVPVALTLSIFTILVLLPVPYSYILYRQYGSD